MKNSKKPQIDLNAKKLFNFKKSPNSLMGLSTGDPTTSTVISVSTVMARYGKR